MSAALKIDQSGTLKSGPFYAVRLTLIHDMRDVIGEWYVKEPFTIVQHHADLRPKDAGPDDMWFYVENCSDYKERDVVDVCPMDRSHERGAIYTACAVDLFGGPLVPPIIADDFCIVSGGLKKQI